MASGGASAFAAVARPERVKAPLVIENAVSAPAWITLTPEVRIEAEPLSRALQPWLAEPALGRLFSSNPGLVPLRALREAGLSADFDERAVELRVLVPAPLRKTTALSLANDARAPLGPVYDPAPVSAYVNAYGAQDFQSTGGRQPVLANFDSALNARGWVLESAASYREQAGWRRGDLRLVRDDPDHLLRYAAGDLSYPVSGYQRFVPMAGFTVARNFNLRPNRVFYPTGRNEIYLETASTVRVSVNGRPFRELELPAGPHRFDDLPLVTGVNRVRLDITDAYGRTRTEEFPYAFDAQLLERGVQQFAYSLGVPSFEGARARHYERANPSYAAFHRVGWTRTLTAGVYAQGDARQSLAGMEGLGVTELGSFSFETAFSRAAAPGAAARLGYQYTNLSDIERRFSLGVETLSRRFAPLGNLTPDNAERVTLSAGYTQPLGRALSISLSGQNGFGPAGYRSAEANVSLSRSWPNGLQAGVDLNYRRLPARHGDYGAFANLLWAIPESRHLLAARTDTRAQTTRAEWQYRPANRVGGINADVATERAARETRFIAQADYAGTRGVGSLEHAVTRPDTGGGGLTQVTRLRGGAALAFAGGHLAVGRPINDSFAIVAKRHELGGTPVEINPGDEGYFEARADALGPALAAEIPSYREQALHLGAREMPLGQELGPEYRGLRPTYRSGTFIEAGTPATVFARGTLLDARRRPLALKAGQLAARDGRQPPILIFTNRAGRFQAEGLRPGSYELQLFDEALGESPASRIDVPPQAAGLIDLGVLRWDTQQ